MKEAGPGDKTMVQLEQTVNLTQLPLPIAVRKRAEHITSRVLYAGI